MATKKRIPSWVKGALEIGLEMKALSTIAPSNGTILRLSIKEAVSEIRSQAHTNTGRTMTHKEAEGFYREYLRRQA